MIFPVILVLLFAGSCKKNRNQIPPDNPYGLPNATQSGANIFACRINSQNWISQKGPNHLRGGIQNNVLSAGGFSEQAMGISIMNFSHSLLNYQLHDTINAFGIYQVNNSCMANPSGGYGGVTFVKSINGLLSLSKVDTIKKIIAGTFWFKIKTDLCDTLSITDGRFDIRYH